MEKILHIAAKNTYAQRGKSECVACTFKSCASMICAHTIRAGARCRRASNVPCDACAGGRWV
eukprot:6211452-Pleurochrysis_carterae.AAC.1